MRMIAAVLILLAPSSLLAESFYCDEFYVDMAPGLSTAGGELSGGVCGQAPVTDVAPADFVIHSAPAYAQGGQTASSLIAMGGLAEKKITCDDFADAAGDSVVATVNGVALTALVEGVDWDCITSNAVCCANLAPVMDAQAGYSAVAVGAAVFLTPNQCPTWGLSTAITDNVADPFGVSDNGTDGSVVLSEFVALGGTTSGHSAIKRSAAEVHMRNGDDTNFATTRTGFLVATTSVTAGASASFIFQGRSLTLSSDNGKWNVANATTTDMDQVTFGPETDQYPSLYPDGAAGVTLAGGAAVTDAMDFTVTGNRVQNSANGGTVTSQFNDEVLTFQGGGGDAAKTTSGLVPIGAQLESVATFISTTGTGCAAIDIGTTADDDHFSEESAVAATTTTTNADWSATGSNPQLTATGVKVTGTDGATNPANCIDLVIRVEVWYKVFTAPTG